MHFNNGGFTHHEVWELPITMRRYYLMKTREFFKKLKDEREAASGQITDSTPIDSIKKIDVPDHLMPKESAPSYVTKAKK